MEFCITSLNNELLKKSIQSTDQVLKIIFDLIDGLIELRSFNILHSDIKPGNILKTKEGNYKISDFGISVKL